MLLGGGGRPSDAAPSPSPTPPPSRPSMPETLRPPRMGSASSFSTNGDAFFLLPRPRGIVVQASAEAGEGRRLFLGIDAAAQTNMQPCTSTDRSLVVYVTVIR